VASQAQATADQTRETVADRAQQVRAAIVMAGLASALRAAADHLQ
jgi:hypothetical protein